MVQFSAPLCSTLNSILLHACWLQVPAEYPLRPSLISLTEDGNSTVQEELRTISNEVIIPMHVLPKYFIFIAGAIESEISDGWNKAR